MPPPSTTRRGPYAKSLALRTSIARVVLDLVDDLGHEGVTTPVVAARLDMPEATVLYHFPTRDHLLIAALELADDLGEQEVQQSPPAPLDIARLHATVQPDQANRERLGVLLRGLSATPGHPAEGYFRRRTQRSIEIFTASIAALQERGDVHPGIDPRRVATQMTALWEGLAASHLLDPSLDVAGLLVEAFRRLSGQNLLAIRDVAQADDSV